MKKLFSALVVLCMFISTTAFAFETDAVATFEADKTTVKVGETVNFAIKVSADSNGALVNGSALTLKFDSTMMEIDAANITTGTITTYTRVIKRVSGTGDTKTLMLQNNGVTSSGDTLLSGEQTMFTFKAKALKAGTFTFTKVGKPGVTMSNPAAISETKLLEVAMPTITITADEPAGITEEYPTTGAAGQGLVDKKVDEDGTYHINAKAPIGKKAVITIDGSALPEVGHIYNGKPSTSVKVEFVDDDATVITYPIVYQDTNCAVIFGKGTIGAEDKYGIKVAPEGGAYKTKEAIANADGIFGVKFDYVNKNGEIAPDGTYTAKAFVGETDGAEISFTK